VLQKLLAADIFLVDTLLSEQGHYLGFGSDTGVVGAGHPAGFLALHAGAAHQHVLDGIVEHVAHVQHARHVGRRYHDGVGLLAGVGGGFEKALLLPALVPLGFNVGGRISFGERHRRFKRIKRISQIRPPAAG